MGQCIIAPWADTAGYMLGYLTIMASENGGLSPGKHQAIIRTNAEIS